jgi:hypothetical protein
LIRIYEGKAKVFKAWKEEGLVVRVGLRLKDFREIDSGKRERGVK